jgi:hypothetical protein
MILKDSELGLQGSMNGEVTDFVAAVYQKINVPVV